MLPGAARVPAGARVADARWRARRMIGLASGSAGFGRGLPGPRLERHGPRKLSYLFLSALGRGCASVSDLA